MINSLIADFQKVKNTKGGLRCYSILKPKIISRISNCNGLNILSKIEEKLTNFYNKNKVKNTPFVVIISDSHLFSSNKPLLVFMILIKGHSRLKEYKDIPTNQQNDNFW